MVDAESIRRAPFASQYLSRLSRWLELRAIGLTPEHLHIEDGVRAAVIVMAPLLLIIITGERSLGWAIFAAFWTCLADTGGPEKSRRALLAGFVLLGSVTAWVTSYIAGLGMLPALVAGPVLVGLTALLPLRWRGSALVATLLGVVAVVAAGYPQTPAGAIRLGLTFLGGGAWAALVSTYLWRTDRWLPARQAMAAVYARLADMAADLNNPAGDKSGEDQGAKHGQFRRAIRGAIERANTQMGKAAGRSGFTPADLKTALATADEIFHAMIALDHSRLIWRGNVHVETAVEPLPRLLAAARNAQLSLRGEPIDWREQAAELSALVKPCGGAAAGALRAIAEALSQLHAPTSGPAIIGADDTAAARAKQILRIAVRTSVGVALVTIVTHMLSLSYPYWATMAVVVIMQPVRRMSWSRGIERILGSVSGGVLAGLLLPVLTSSWTMAAVIALVSAATIALRSVNYTVFVVFLTLLFVLVMHTLHPGSGIASARILDNVLGSFVAILATLLIWPDRGRSVGEFVPAAVNANRAYLEAVQKGDAQEIAAARRAAGLASTDAEIAIHAPDSFLGSRPTAENLAALRTARHLAGEAATLWYAKQGG